MREFYKISVWDFNLKGFIVKHCSLPKWRAKELEKIYKKKGLIVRISRNVEDINERRKRKNRDVV